MVRGRQTARRYPAPEVEIRASAPCEYLLHLSECSIPGIYAATALGQAWFDEVRAGIAPELLAAIERFSTPDASLLLWPRLLGLADETPAPRDVPAFLAHLAALPPMQLPLTLLGYHAGPLGQLAPSEATYLAAQGDAAAVGAVAARHFPNDGARRDALVALLAAGPARASARLLALLGRWYDEAFRAREAAILPILARDAAAQRALRGTLALEQLVEALTNGNEYRPDPGIRRVALVPTYVMRPFTETQRHRATDVICYPVADESLAEAMTGPPARLVRLHQALGDERRLRILRHLARERATFQELAAALDLPKSSLFYHIGILRAVGLLRVGAAAKGGRYGLRREGLADMGDELLRYLEGSAENTEDG